MEDLNMKKILPVLFCAAVSAVFAGNDLPIDGKFRQLKNDLPVQWTVTAPGSAKIVRGGELSRRALELTAGKNPVQAVSKVTFLLPVNAELEVEAEIKGSGNAFIAVEFTDDAGKVVSTARIAGQSAAGRFTDIKGKFRNTGKVPLKGRIVLGVEPGSQIVFDDVEAEIDRD